VTASRFKKQSFGRQRPFNMKTTILPLTAPAMKTPTAKKQPKQRKETNLYENDGWQNQRNSQNV
jgi:hypothetical protein